MSVWRELYPFASHWFTPPDTHRGAHASDANGSTSPAALGPKAHGPKALGPAAPRMHYVDEGAGSQTIVCVHGNPTWSFYYRTIVQQQRDRARVIAVDNMGCGLSDKPQQYRYELDQHIANLVALIRHLDLQRVTLVVHDWGGAIGLGAGLELPERIAGLVILNTAAFPPSYLPLRIAACRLPLIGNWAMRQLNLFARAALTMTLNRLPRLPDAVAAGLIAPYNSWEHRVAIARFVQDIPRSATDPTWQRLQTIERNLPQLDDRPVRIVWGMRDWCFRPECLTRFEQLLPGAVVKRLDDVGHYVMEEAAAEVNLAVADCLEAQAN